MATRDEQLQVLAVEVQTDPLGRGYNGLSDAEVADSLNVRDRPTLGGPVSLTELYQSLIDGGELSDLRAVDAQGFQQSLLLGHNGLAGSLEVDGQDYIEIAQIYPGGSQTRINMNNRVNGFESRGEELELPRPIKEGWVNEARQVQITTEARNDHSQAMHGADLKRRKALIIRARLGG